MGNIKTAFRLMKFNWTTLWRFEVLFMVCGVGFISLVSSTMLKLTMRAQGQAFISADNLVSLLINPLTWLYVIFIVLFVAFVCLFEAGCLMFLFDASRQEKKADIRTTFLFGWRNSIRIFKDKGKNLSIIISMIVLMPFFGMGVLGAFFESIQIPEFISEAISKNMLYSVALVVAFIVLLFFVVRWCFSLHYYTLDSCNAKESRQKSIAVGFKGRVVSLLMALVVLTVVVLLALIVALIAVAALAFVYFSLDLTVLANAFIFGFSIVLVVGVLLVCYVFILPLSTLALSVSFYRHKEKRGEEPVNLEIARYQPMKSLKIVTWTIAGMVAVLCALILSAVIYFAATGGLSEYIEGIFGSNARIEITAHRGGSHAAPENTMAAFKNAAKDEADWCELDVQMSADGKLFIMHDTSFERTCGVAANTWELTWSEIQKLDASYGWTEYAGEKVPSLEEVIDWAKTSGMKLNIEIKPTGHEPSSLEQAVVDMINQKDFKEQCWVASLNYDVLEKVKSIDPSIHTLLNMVLAYGNISQMSAADNFSVEASMVTNKIIESAHSAGKKIAVWTVNDETNMAAVVLTDIDNIVTDEVTKARNQVSLFSGSGVAKMMELVSSIKHGTEAQTTTGENS